ncbi:MAG TPA: hypothetical protein VF823_10070 [Anaerolineales bacterium]
MLRKNFFSAAELEAIVRDFHSAGLPPQEVAMMEYAQKVTRDANGVTPQDIQHLQEAGFSDVDILDITLAAAARNFYGRVLDALGAQPDEVYQKTMEDSLYKVLSGESESA